MVFVEVPGRIIIYDWSAFKIQVGDVVLDAVISLSCKRTNTKTVGDCNIIVADEYGDLYDSLDYLDEIEIYIQDPDNYYIPNKVWGGWLEDVAYMQGKTHQLKIAGKEYSSALFDKLYTNDFVAATDLGVICANIVDDNGTLSSANIPSSTFKELQVNFSKERHWDALDTVTNLTGFEFGVDLEEVVYLREVGNAPISPDVIELSENVKNVSQEAQGKNLVSSVTVQGQDSTITSTSTDDEVAEMYRERQLYSVVSDATNTGTTGEASLNTLDTQKNLLKRYTVNTLFLPQTEPNDLIEVTIEGTELSSDYKVISIEHTITRKGNIFSQVVLNQGGLDDSDILSNLLKSYSKTELKTWQ